MKFGGLKFLDAAHIKDVLTLLRWSLNPKDRVSAFRVAQLMPGIGPAATARLLERMDSSLDTADALRSFRPPTAASEAWPAFAELFRLLRSNAAGWSAELDLVCQWYLPHLERNHDDAAAIRQPDLIQLAQIAASYHSRERFLTELTLDPPDATSDEAGPPLQDEDHLILSTSHSAKGQEWKSVFVLNTVDGCIPADLALNTREELEEERRLLYVAMTRAKDHLHLMDESAPMVARTRRHSNVILRNLRTPNSFRIWVPTAISRSRPRLALPFSAPPKISIDSTSRQTKTPLPSRSNDLSAVFALCDPKNRSRTGSSL